MDVQWNLDNMESIDGCRTEIVGAPRLIDTDSVPAIEFDGVGDALVVDANPLAGLDTFTAEILFRPYPNGPSAQRFFHIQEDGSDNRLLFETRLTADEGWFLDTFISSEGEGYVQFAENFVHPLGPWYHAAIVVADGMFRHYVDGELELETEIAFTPLGRGQTSIGVRYNRASWYRGAIRTARFSSRPLAPDEFLGIE
jgi:hypothetical protein